MLLDLVGFVLGSALGSFLQYAAGYAFQSVGLLVFLLMFDLRQ